MKAEGQTHTISSNDDYANRAPLNGSAVTLTGYFPGATYEGDEPGPRRGMGSIWWSWRAPASGPVTLTAEGGLASVSVYAGTTLADLALLTNGYGRMKTQSGDPGPLRYSEIDRGVIVDMVRPTNDLFANRVTITGSVVSVTGSTFRRERPTRWRF